MQRSRCRSNLQKIRVGSNQISGILEVHRVHGSKVCLRIYIVIRNFFQTSQIYFDLNSFNYFFLIRRRGWKVRLNCIFLDSAFGIILIGVGS